MVEKIEQFVAMFVDLVRAFDTIQARDLKNGSNKLEI